MIGICSLCTSVLRNVTQLYPVHKALCIIFQKAEIQSVTNQTCCLWRVKSWQRRIIFVSIQGHERFASIDTLIVKNYFQPSQSTWRTDHNIVCAKKCIKGIYSNISSIAVGWDHRGYFNTSSEGFLNVPLPSCHSITKTLLFSIKWLKSEEMITMEHSDVSEVQCWCVDKKQASEEILEPFRLD